MSRERRAEQAKRRRDAARLLPYNPADPWHGTTTGYTNYCCRRECCRTPYRAYVNEWRKRPEVAEHRRTRARELARRPDQRLKQKARQYGLEVDLLDSYLSDRVCFACGATDVALAVDHDHRCCVSSRKVCGECVRGLLCDSCNKALGLVGDDIERLRSLIAYLERWEQRAFQ